MGRTDPVQFTNELVAEWRRLGAEVTFEPGWDTRGVNSTSNYEGAIIHHTGIGTSEASPFTGRNTLLNGRPDLKGPLCNSAGPWCPPDRPRIHVISARPANHAGASGGRSMGPLPVTGSFNSRVWGHEIDYGGNVPMSPGQYTAALIVAKGVANVLRRSIEYVRAHAETSVTGKWDPGYAPGRTLDMAVFRRDAAAFSGSQGSSIVLDDATQLQISKIVVNALTTPLIPVGPNLITSVLDQMAYDAQGLAMILGKVEAQAELIRQLTAKAGGTSAAIDLKAIEEAGRRGAQSALDELTVTVSTSDDTPA